MGKPEISSFFIFLKNGIFAGFVGFAVFFFFLKKWKMWYFCIFLYFHKSTFFIKYHFLHYYKKGWFSKYMGFSSKTDVFGFLGFRIWDTYIGLLGISMWINLWCGSDGSFRRFRRFVQMIKNYGWGWRVGLVGWSSWVGRYILLINPVEKKLVWWVVFPGWAHGDFQEGSWWFPVWAQVDFMYKLMWKWWVWIKMVKRCWLSI